LRLTPTAWSKLLFLRDAGPTEIGGFGIASPDDLLLLDDVRLVRQRCDWASVELEDAAVADFFDLQVELGRRPEQFARVWVHTHPGESPQPSATDEETFARVFGPCDWSLMLILAAGGATYARLQFTAGPGGGFELPVQIDYQAEFSGTDPAAWQAEYLACVMADRPVDAATATRELQHHPHAYYYDYDFPREAADDAPW
jgi:proteasome lid subunit RPN8/RPN11